MYNIIFDRQLCVKYAFLVFDQLYRRSNKCCALQLSEILKPIQLIIITIGLNETKMLIFSGWPDYSRCHGKYKK